MFLSVSPNYQDFKILFCSAQSVQNLGLAVVSILAGIIVDKGGYLMLEMFFLGWLWGEYFFFFNLWSSNDIDLSLYSSSSKFCN